MIQLFDFGDGIPVPVRIHENGGGVVALTASVDPSVYVGQGCKIWGHAKIRDNVRLVGRVQIRGDNMPGDVSVQIEDNVSIIGSVQVFGTVLLRDQVELRDNVKLVGCVHMMHRSRACGNTYLEGDVKVRDQAYLVGNTRIVSLSHRTIIQGQSFMDGTRQEHVLSPDTQRKRRTSALRPVVFDTQAA